MINTLRKLVLLFVISSLFINASIARQKLFDGIEDEYKIDLSKGFEMSNRKANKRVNWMDDKVKIGSKLDRVYQSGLKVKVNHFNKLYQIAKASRNPVIDNKLHSEITGFIISYGLSESGQILLFFNPWVMKSEENGKYVNGKVIELNNDSIYVYDKEEGFYSISKKNPIYDKPTKRFREQIRIQDRNNNKEFRHCEFIESKWQSDSEKAFFNFQQLKKLYEDKFPSDKENSYHNEIVFFEGVILKEFQIHGRKRTRVQRWFTKTRNKITSFFTTEAGFDELIRDDSKKLKLFSETGMENVFANLTGLCPPACQGFRYPIITP